jgi:putative NADH-flavin reductase
MKLAILGGTGQTGRLLVELALGARHEVTVLARDPAKLAVQHPSLRVVKGDARDAGVMDQALAGAEVVISAIGSDSRRKATLREEAIRNALAAMKKHGGRRIILMSAAGVGDSLPQIQKASFLLGRVLIPLLLKDAFADALAAENLIKQSGLQWVLVRPVGLGNAPPKRNVTAITDLTSTEGLKMTIPRADVARFLLIQATEDRYLGQAVTLSS